MTFEEWLGNQIDERNEIYVEIGQECYDNGYQQGRADVWADIDKIINGMTNPIDTMKIIIEQLKENNNVNRSKL